MTIASKNYLVKNLDEKPCQTCDGVHEYYSRAADRAPCGTPVAWSLKFARAFAKLEGYELDKAVVPVPDDTVVVLDPSARKLRKQNDGGVALNQVESVMKLA